MDLLSILIEIELEVVLGRHVGYEGYFAGVYQGSDFDSCEECEYQGPMVWSEVGHGATLESAILNGCEVCFGIARSAGIDQFEALK